MTLTSLQRRVLRIQRHLIDGAHFELRLLVDGCRVQITLVVDYGPYVFVQIDFARVGAHETAIEDESMAISVVFG